MPMPKSVVIGGGHNGLVAAAELAHEGYNVTLLESRHMVGGAASTSTNTFHDFKISTASYLNSLLLPEIVRKLELERHGYEFLPRNPSSFTPLPDGKGSLLLGPDMDFNQAQIAQFSPRDAVMYPRYERELGEIADWMAEMMTMIPPSGPLPRKWTDVKSLLVFGRHLCKLGFMPWRTYELIRLVLTDPVAYLNRWFESDILKATLLTDALIGSTKLSGYVLLHHVMGGAGGSRGAWGYVRGGMGGISNALAAACRERDVKIILRARAERIVLAGKDRVAGVWATVKGAGEEDEPEQHYYEADTVVSAINPTITFGKLLKEVQVVDTIRKKVVGRDSASGSMKVNLKLSGVPAFTGIPGLVVPGPHHQGTIHIAPSVEYILKALRDYQEGRSSDRPILEITIPSVVDNTLAPEGFHVMNIFVQYVRFSDKDWKNERIEYFRNAILPLMREYMPNIAKIIKGVQILTPQDLEREFGMVGGNIFHGGMGLDQLWWNRPAPGCADYRVPGIKGLYLSGAGTHPGGGVCGAAGYNTARVVLEDLKS